MQVIPKETPALGPSSLLKEGYNMNLEHYELLAQLFDYPDIHFPERVGDILKFLRKNYPQAAEELNAFTQNLPGDNLDKMQELFTRTFDIQAITTLDIGYVLFGDDYKRGELLANLNREHKQAGNYCGCELSDHFPNVLRLLPKCKDQELIEELVYEIIAPALKKMIAEFDPHQLEKKNKLYKKHYKTLIESPIEKATIYCYTLKTMEIIIKQDFDFKEQPAPSQQTQDFLQSLGTEMVVEKVESE